MDITLADSYTDKTHIFGIAYVTIDGMDEQGRTRGVANRRGERNIHRDNMTRQQAIDWMEAIIEDKMNADVFRIVAMPKLSWEIAETGDRAQADVTLPKDEELLLPEEDDLIVWN